MEKRKGKTTERTFLRMRRIMMQMVPAVPKMMTLCVRLSVFTLNV